MEQIINFYELKDIKETFYRGSEAWRAIQDICKENLKGQYEVLFYNIPDSSRFPEVLKFVAFDWENLKVLVYREPEIRIYTFKDYNDTIRALNRNKPHFEAEGIKLDKEETFKRIQLFKDLDKQPIKEIRRARKYDNQEIAVKLGDFLSTCWGYDQTNVELFVVKKIIGKNYLVIQEISQQTEDTQMTYSKIRVSDDVRKIDIPVKAYISNDGYMSVCEQGYKRSLSITKLTDLHYKTDPMFGH